MIAGSQVLTRPNHPVFYAIGSVEPIARGVIEDIKIHPWIVLYRANQEQGVFDILRAETRRVADRIITTPFEKLEQIPLLSKGTMQLQPRDPKGRFKKK